MNYEWLMRLVWSRSPTTLGILKIIFHYIQLPLHRTIIYLNHTREGSTPEIPRDNPERHSRDPTPSYEI